LAVGQVQGAVQVHRVRRGRVQVAQRVVGERGQAEDRVIARQLAGDDVPHVDGRPRPLVGGRPEVASLVKAQVEPIDFVPGGSDERNQNGAYVTAVARNEDFHRTAPPGLARGILPQ